MSSLRLEVKSLYKKLIFLGRDYPQGCDYFRQRCHRAFMKNKDEKSSEKIEQLIRHGEYIVKELEALYKLKKYRALKRMYYDSNDWATSYQAKLQFLEKQDGNSSH